MANIQFDTGEVKEEWWTNVTESGRLVTSATAVAPYKSIQKIFEFIRRINFHFQLNWMARRYDKHKNQCKREEKRKKNFKLK